MEVVLAVVVVVALVLGAGRLAFMGRNRRRERIEVEDMFAPDRRDRAWWEERH